jgi:hypothetical protein
MRWTWTYWLRSTYELKYQAMPPIQTFRISIHRPCICKFRKNSQRKISSCSRSFWRMYYIYLPINSNGTETFLTLCITTTVNVIFKRIYMFHICRYIVLLKARLISVEIKFMRRTASYIWSDFKQNTEILEELKSHQLKIRFKMIKQTGEIMWTGCIDQGYQN